VALTALSGLVRSALQARRGLRVRREVLERTGVGRTGAEPTRVAQTPPHAWPVPQCAADPSRAYAA